MDRSFEQRKFGNASHLATYGIAAAAVVAATIVRWLLDPVLGNNVPYATFYLAVVVAGWYGGLRPALLATLLSLLLAWALFVPPRFSFALLSTADLGGLVVFLIASMAIAGFSGTLRAAERRSARAEYIVREQAERLRTTLASIGDAVITTDTEGSVTNLNGVAESLTGWTNELALGQPLSRVFNIVNEETRQAVENPAIKALRDGVIVGLANHTVLIAKDGTERPIDDSAAPILCKEGEIVGCVLVFRDISERKLLEAEQRNAEAQVATTIESITDGFMRLDQDWRVVYENAEAERLNQLPRSQTLGKTIWELFPAVVGTKFEAEYRRCVAEQVSIEFENFYEPWSRWYSLKCYPMADGGMSVYIRDTTEHKQADEVLRLNRNRLDFVLMATGVGLWLNDLPLSQLNWDDRMRALFFVPPGVEPTIELFYDRLHPEDREPTRMAVEGAMRDGTHYDIAHRVVDPATGATRWIKSSGQPIYDDNGKAIRFDGVSIDLTDRKEAEWEIARLAAESDRERRLYETVLTNTPDFVYVFSLDHKVLYANDALIKMWGRGHDGAIGKTFLEIGYEPWHAEMHDREIDQVVATRQPIRGEVPFNGTNGRRIYDYIFVPIFGADGDVEAVAGTTRDVTERHDAQAELRESEERSVFVRRSSGVGFWYCDLPFDVLQWDELVKAHFHLPPDAAVTIDTFYDRLHPDDREPTRQAIERSIAGQTPYNVDYRTVDPDSGAVTWVRAIGRTFYAADGTPSRFDGVTLDVTDQKRSEERQAFLFRLADTLRPLSDPVEVQAEASRVLGEHLGANRVVYFEIRGDEYIIERDYTAGVLPLAGQYPVSAFGPAELDALLNGRTVIEADATTEPDRPAGERAAFAAIQVRGHVDVPLVKDGRFVAGMTVQVSDRRDWNPREVALIEDTAERTWAAVERARAEDALRQSEERRRLALDAAELGAWQINLITNTFTNDERFCIIFSGTADAMNYEQAFAAIHPDDQERIREAVAASTRSDDPAPYAEEYRVVHPDGSVRWVFAKGRANFTGDGPGRQLVSFDGTISDITARKEAEVRLHESEERFRLMADAAPVMIWMSGADKLVNWYNRPWLEFTGRSMEHEVGKGATEVVHPDDLGSTIPQYLAAFEARAPFSMEYRLRRHDGEFRWMICNGVPRYRADGEFEGYIGSCFDVTDYKNAQATLRDADRRKDEFLATLAHELRNPLAPIRNGLEVIRIAGANGTIEQARSMMERQLGQMVRLVDDLLDVSRVTSGKLELRQARVELRAVIDAAVETSRPIIEEACHKFTIVVPDEPIWVDGDVTRLAQVVSNLLNNSAKYMHRGGHVRLTVGLEDDIAIVSVADDGIGIPPAMLDKVFEMFAQVDRALEKTTGGLGIGLSLVKGLVEMHGGTIEARSEGEGRGSEFVVRLPVVLSTVQNVAPHEVDGHVGSSCRRRILVADDNVDSAKSMGKLLELLGNDVSIANDGLQAVNVAETFRPDVILLDIGMPKLNGYEAAQHIRAHEWGQDTILLALTGWGQEDDRKKSSDAGFDHHLVKPVEIAVLRKLLAGVEAKTK